MVLLGIRSVLAGGWISEMEHAVPTAWEGGRGSPSGATVLLPRQSFMANAEVHGAETFSNNEGSS